MREAGGEWREARAFFLSLFLSPQGIFFLYYIERVQNLNCLGLCWVQFLNCLGEGLVQFLNCLWCWLVQFLNGWRHRLVQNLN